MQRRRWLRDAVIPLAEVEEGAEVRVVGVAAGRGLARRLHELGILPGTRMKVLRSLRPGPVLVRLLTDGDLSLGYGVAMKIMVEVIK